MRCKINCPEGHVLTVPDQRAGTYVRCPICLQMVKIPPAEQLAKLGKAKPSAKRKSTDQQPETPGGQTAKMAAGVEPTRSPDERPRLAEPAAKLSAQPSKTAAAEEPKQKPAVASSPARLSPISPSKPASSSGPRQPLAGEKPAAAPAQKRLELKTAWRASAERAKADSTPHDLGASKSEVTSRSAVRQIERPSADKPTQSSGAARSELAQPSAPAAKGGEKQSADQPASLPVRGVEHDAAKRWTAYSLAIALAIVALLNLGPGVLEIADYLKNLDSDFQQPVARWAYAALLIGGVQLFYAVYLVQLPDWGSVWVVAVVTLLIASGYAMVLGVVWFGQDDGQIVQALQLSGDIRGRAALWCFSMVSVTSLLTYFCGREGLRWYKIYTLQAAAAGGKP